MFGGCDCVGEGLNRGGGAPQKNLIVGSRVATQMLSYPPNVILIVYYLIVIFTYYFMQEREADQGQYKTMKKTLIC